MIRASWIRLLTCAVIFGGTAAALAQPPAPGSGIIGIAHIALRASDVDKEVAFLGKLGFEEAFTSILGANALEVFVKVNDRQFIEVYSRTDKSQPLGWMHVCFEAGDLNALQKFYASTDLNPTPVKKASAGNLLSTVKDPSGNVVEFTQYMPGSRHTLDKGQHLGADRISDAIIGYVMPVREPTVMRNFYAGLGFEAEDAGNAVHLTTPGAPDLRVEIRQAVAGSRPQILFPVPDARKAADQLRREGVDANRQDKIVFVRDEDGNSFVLLETGSKD
ncbi:MAG TPA: VOC family protein [Terracidiphilus sp.]|nr:VOC family protein [Terracidiphilus sp.]